MLPPRPAWGAAILIVIATSLPRAEASSRTVRGLTSCRMDEKECADKAHAFSPILWLAPDELAYPTLPHPFAFDGVDNDADGSVDLDDPDEVEALIPKKKCGPNDKKYKCDAQEMKKQLGLLLKRLKKYNELLAMDRVPVEELDLSVTEVRSLADFKLCRQSDGGAITCGPPAAVLYQMQRRDEQSVSGEDSGLPDRMRREVDVLQYWMYFPWDDEHLHDGEHVSVFVPRSQMPYGSPVEAIVGAGHIPSTGNNILVSTPWEPPPQKSETPSVPARESETPPLVGPHTPWRIPPHLPVLVEMGKHSSSPDLNCNGRFDVGLDANVLPAGAWGTRDVNFALDKSQWGELKDWYSLQRARSGLLTERSFHSKQDDDLKAGGVNRRWAFIQACPEASLGRELLLLLDKPPVSGPARDGYRLVDAAVLREIARAARDEKGATVQRLLFDHRELLFASPTGWDSASDVTYDRCALARWAEAEAIGSQPRPDVWNHTDFGRYTNDFKLDTFSRFSVGPIFSAANGNGRFGVFARFSDFHLFGKRIAPDSSFEVQVLLDRLRVLNADSATSVSRINSDLLGRDSSPNLEVGVFYNAFSTAYRGPYVGARYEGSRLNYRREYLYPEGRVDDPASTDYVAVERLSQNVYVEAGYSVTLPVLDKLVPRGALKRFIETHPLQVRFGIAGPLFRLGRKQDTREPGVLRAYNVPRSVEFTVSAQLVGWNVVGRRHPLQGEK